LRLQLLYNKCTLWNGVPGGKSRCDAASRALFAPQVELLMREGETAMQWDSNRTVKHGVLQLSGRTTGRRWALLACPPDLSDPVHAGVNLHRIIELPRGAASTIPATADGKVPTDVGRARELLRARSGAAALPKLPAPGCAHCCLAGATKRCGACGGPAYCDAICQKAHWKAHKRECKAKAEPAKQGAGD